MAHNILELNDYNTNKSNKLNYPSAIDARNLLYTQKPYTVNETSVIELYTSSFSSSLAQALDPACPFAAQSSLEGHKRLCQRSLVS